MRYFIACNQLSLFTIKTIAVEINLNIRLEQELTRKIYSLEKTPSLDLVANKEEYLQQQ